MMQQINAAKDHIQRSGSRPGYPAGRYDYVDDEDEDEYEDADYYGSDDEDGYEEGEDEFGPFAFGRMDFAAFLRM
jgi:hypothetical protein